MHPICSWMVAVAFGDSLTLTRSTGGGSSYEIICADDAPTPQPIDWPIESDLAFRAHGLIQQHIGEDLPVNMELTKRIPAGAGLGGGSSDAAAMLVGLNNLFALGLSQDGLVELGLRLGSDVGFLVSALHENVSAIVTGIGDRIEPTPLTAPLHMVLIFPQIHCATSEVYQRFDRACAGPGVDEAKVRGLAKTSPLPEDQFFNDLAAPAFLTDPGLGTLFERVGTVLNRPVHLSGSGSTMFLVAPDAELAGQWANQVTASTSLPALATQTLPI